MKTYRTQKERDSRAKTTLKIFLAVAIIATIVTSIVTVASRLTDEALAVLAGAGCGVAAAIPTSLLIFAVSNRKRSDEQPKSVPRQQTTATAPPIIVVTPQGLQQQQPQLGFTSYDHPQAAPRPPREFTVVGDGEYE